MSISYVITSYSQFQEKKTQLLVKLFLTEIKPKQTLHMMDDQNGIPLQ